MRFASLLDSPVRAKKIFDARINLAEFDSKGDCRVRVFREPDGGSMVVFTAQDRDGEKNVPRISGALAGVVARKVRFNTGRVLFMNHHRGEAYYDIIDFDVYDGRNFLNPSYTEVR